ncbi:uncharacterized protein [Amphiura filiformis]|uniref:uncharacterized protein n=1 Tax=Amphiura filiformis TaxID=82378 RepID=UPI003B20DF44
MESATRMMRNVTNEVDVMLQLADKMHELAEHLKLLVSTSSRHVNIPEVERLTDGAFSSVLRDMRRETLHCIIDGQRACVRYEKVMNDLRRLRRSLRNMGQWKTAVDRSGAGSSGRADSTETICPDGDWGLPRYSYFNSP